MQLLLSVDPLAVRCDHRLASGIDSFCPAHGRSRRGLPLTSPVPAAGRRSRSRSPPRPVVNVSSDRDPWDDRLREAAKSPTGSSRYSRWDQRGPSGGGSAFRGPPAAYARDMQLPLAPRDDLDRMRLRAPDFGHLVPFQRSFYQESPQVAARSEAEVQSYRASKGMSIEGPRGSRIRLPRRGQGETAANAASSAVASPPSSTTGRSSRSRRPDSRGPSSTRSTAWGSVSRHPSKRKAGQWHCRATT